MSISIVRWSHPSPKDCLLSAAAVCLSTHLPAQQNPDGSWTGQLDPGTVVRDYERANGPVPTYGASPGRVWDLCQTYGFEAHYPAAPFGWDWTLIADVLQWAPLLVSFYNSWTWTGEPLTSHAVVLYGLAEDRLAIWDQDVGREITWSIEDFYFQPVWRDGGWIYYPRWSGWAILLAPPDWGDPLTW